MPSGVVHIGEGWPVGGRLGFFLGGPVRAPTRAARSFAHALTAAGSASSGVNNLRLSPDLGSRTMGGGDPFAESQRPSGNRPQVLSPAPLPSGDQGIECQLNHAAAGLVSFPSSREPAGLMFGSSAAELLMHVRSERDLASRKAAL